VTGFWLAQTPEFLAELRPGIDMMSCGLESKNNAEDECQDDARENGVGSCR
jgi:hypothetical protein